MKYTKRENGITLIALVVTIIVLLILAGVTIQMVVGQNGILARAQEAKEKSEIAEYKEEMELLLLDMQTESILSGESDEDFLQRYKTALEEMYGEDVTVEELEDGSKLKVTTKEGYEFEVSTEGVEYKGKTGEVKPEPEPETEVTITYDNINWSKTKEVTIEAEGKEIEYAEGEEAYNSDLWTPYTNKLTITENNTVLYAKVNGTDKSKAKKEVIAKIDNVNPKEITLAKQSEEETIVEVKATATDGDKTDISGQSGIKKFIFEIATDEGSYTTPTDGTKEVEASATAEATYTYKGLEEGHTYKLRVKAYDQAENEIILQDGGVVEVEKKKQGTAPEEVVSDLSTYIGAYVNYGVNLDGNTGTPDWRILYAQNNRIYLIAADYVPTDNAALVDAMGGGTTKAMMKLSTSSSYKDLCVKWASSSLPSDLQTITLENWANIFKDGSYDLNKNSTNPNSRCVARLRETTNWAEFAKGTGGEYAIGGPTAQMWCAAWNTIIPEEGKVEGEDTYKQITADVTDTYGYKCTSGSTTATSMHVNGTKTALTDRSTLEKGDTYSLFFPHTESQNITANGKTANCDGYWFASPSAFVADSAPGWYLLGIRYDDVLLGYGYSADAVGVRPVVSLTSGIRLTDSGKIQKGKPVYDIVQ